MQSTVILYWKIRCKIFEKYKMNILIDIGHPAHVHMFKRFAHIMQDKGHSVLFTCRDKEFEIQLLIAEGFKFISFGKKSKSVIGKIINTLLFDLKEIFIAFKFKPDVFLSHGSITAAHAAYVVRKPSIAFEDTFNMEQIRLYEPVTNTILTSDYNHPLHSSRVLKYKGYNELLYLHPNQFTPDKSIINDLGVKEGEPYVVMRFVSWNATHDIGHTGISYANKLHVVEKLSKYAKVFISSESNLPDELKKYKLPTSPEKIHHVLAYSSLVFGESATMVTEGAVLGVPGIYIDNTGRYYTRDIAEKYGLCFNYTESTYDQLSAIEKAVSIFKNGYNKSELQDKCAKLLANTIDVTSFLAWFIENYPQSEHIMRDNPDYQYQFK